MQASDHTFLNISRHCSHTPARLTTFSPIYGFSPTYSMTPWNMSKSEKTIKKRKIRSLRPMFFFFLHSRSQSLNNLASAIYPCRRGQFGQRYIAKLSLYVISSGGHSPKSGNLFLKYVRSLHSGPQDLRSR